MSTRCITGEGRRARRAGGIVGTIEFTNPNPEFSSATTDELSVDFGDGQTYTSPSVAPVPEDEDATQDESASLTGAVAGGVAGAIVVTVAVVLFLRSRRSADKKHLTAAIPPSNAPLGSIELSSLGPNEKRPGAASLSTVDRENSNDYEPAGTSIQANQPLYSETGGYAHAGASSQQFIRKSSMC